MISDVQGRHSNQCHRAMALHYEHFWVKKWPFFKPIKTHRFINFGGSLKIITKWESWSHLLKYTVVASRQNDLVYGLESLNSKIQSILKKLPN